MSLTRRAFGKLAAAGLPVASLAAKPNSKFGGVQIGVITYSFRALPSSAEEVLKYCLECGISAIELMSNVAESYAGAPAQAGRGGGGRGPLTAEQKEKLKALSDAAASKKAAGKPGAEPEKKPDAPK